MKETFLLPAVIATALFAFAIACTQKERAKEPGLVAETRGEALFKQNCFPCHPEGGNVINPKKTLHKKDREANGVETAADIVGKMRNPGPGMTKFDEQTIPDADARAIAEYELKTFN